MVEMLRQDRFHGRKITIRWVTVGAIAVCIIVAVVSSWIVAGIMARWHILAGGQQRRIEWVIIDESVF